MLLVKSCIKVCTDICRIQKGKGFEEQGGTPDVMAGSSAQEDVIPSSSGEGGELSSERW